MAKKWKEVGEVPDSDDENLSDSEESQLDPPPIPNIEENIRTNEVPGSKESKVWDIPSSPQNSEDGTFILRSPSSKSHEALQPTHPDSHSSALSYGSDVARDAATDVRAPEHWEAPEESTNNNNPFSRGISPERVDEENSEPVHNSEEDGTIVRQESARLGRSLRPRKPIQEHPYLLESAQYSKLFKSHGVRPVRVPLEEARARAGEEDSQEQEYEEDSQLTGGADYEQSAKENSRSQQQESFDEEIDLLAFSSPPGPSPLLLQIEASQDKSGNSQNSDDEDELPSLNDLFKNRLNGKSKTYGKRRASPKVSVKRKIHKPHDTVQFTGPSSPRARTAGIFEIPPSPPQTSPAVFSTTPISNVVASRTEISSLTPKPSSANGSRGQTPASGDRVIDLTTLSDLDFSVGKNNGAPTSDDESRHDDPDASSSPEHELNVALQRRIRGVLPASWIRLDQQIPRDKVRKTVPRRSPEHSPERYHRKGVAQRRLVSPKPNNSTPFFFDDDSDEDDTNIRSNGVHELPETGNFSIFEDDAGSVIEEDYIDQMIPSRKRSSSGIDCQPRQIKRRKSQKTFRGQGGPKRQQRITGLLNRSKSSSSRGNTKIGRLESPYGTNLALSRYEKTVTKQATPPRLSILDVVEPDAPRFVRIAARAVSRRPDQGRSSPSRKHISLGTRQDNIDALGVLRNWRNGSIQTRVPSARQPTSSTQPLQSIAHNASLRQTKPQCQVRIPATVPASRFSKSRKLVRQANMNKFVFSESVKLGATSKSLPDENDLSPPPPIRRLLGRSKTHGATYRPAQLETAGEEPFNRQAFHAQKKVLDALYRKSRKSLQSASEARLEHVFRAQAHSRLPPPITEEPPPFDPPNALDKLRSKARPRFRKLVQPKRIDITAPQYAHANDPLPDEPISISEEIAISGPITVSDTSDKLIGLGPFGTQYTQHFEVFPLDVGVYFHQSTLIGEGRLVKAFDDQQLNGITHPRGHCYLALDGKTLKWGPWDAQISSELGVLFDWVLDKIQAGCGAMNADSPGIVQASDFVVNYLQDFINFPSSESGRPFVKRILEVIPGFTARLALLFNRPDSSLRRPIEIMTRCVLIVQQALRVCGKLDLSESLQLEELLKETAKQTARLMLRNNLAELRSFYDDLQNPSSRERGIRNEHYTVIGWVLLMRILQESRIPRANFWDVVSPVMLDNDVVSVSDAQVFERIWRSMFQLLPLSEFDNVGIAVVGVRHTMPLEGWALPQKLLGRVFELYTKNQRQSPSFNEYCRALVSRCHYLVEQWGWRKCNGIIGVIFDFFASQSLSHLRNEEAYRSPQFLEDLAGTPSLTVQPEDRCFHIFLKFLALSIKRLRKYNLIGYVKNLGARVLPNHDRQYLKEKDIHENELAALRNNHDLLCTLFWCVPRELRPSVKLIEKLVVPGSSHKEACLINLRAWNQLARLVASSGEDKSVYKPFADWQNNVFKQVLDQYSSVESDIQQQFLKMSKDASNGVSQELIRRVVNMNKQATMDVLHFSLKANLDVLCHALSLETASIVINTYQLHEVFVRFSYSPVDFDWNTLRVAIDTVGHYLDRIEKFQEQQMTSSETADSWQGDDAIMNLERHISVTFFSMARNLFTNPIDDSQPSQTAARTLCLEQTIIIAGRFAALLLGAGILRLSSFFSPGKYSLFEARPEKLSLHSRKFLCLFVTTLLEKDFSDFTDIGATSLELFLCAITKPSQGLAYENRFAEAMKQHGEPCLRDALVGYGNGAIKWSNRDLFDRTLSTMRKALRVANPSQRQQRQIEFSKAIRAAMDQMKQDLKSMAMDRIGHSDHILFVRSIIPIIKTNDICPVDSFFYQISREYSPSAQDPRLQTAAILSYGLKLEDEDTRAVPGLFYFLYPNFKIALANGKLSEERTILEEGMRNAHIFSFMLGRMLPAIIRTAVRVPDAWLLLEVYVGAVERLLCAACIHREIGEESMNDLLALLKFATAGIQHLQGLDAADFKPTHLCALIEVTKLLNLVGPSLSAFLSQPTNFSSPTGKALEKAMSAFTDFTRAASEHLLEILDASGSDDAVHVDPRRLLEGTRHHHPDPSLDRSEHISGFAKHMTEDIQKNWVTTGTTMSVRGPARAPVPSTQSGQGTKVRVWDERVLAMELHKQLQEWNYTHDESSGSKRWRRRVLFDEDVLF